MIIRYHIVNNGNRLICNNFLVRMRQSGVASPFCCAKRPICHARWLAACLKRLRVPCATARAPTAVQLTKTHCVRLADISRSVMDYCQGEIVSLCRALQPTPDGAASLLSRGQQREDDLYLLLLQLDLVYIGLWMTRPAPFRFPILRLHDVYRLCFGFNALPSQWRKRDRHHMPVRGET